MTNRCEVVEALKHRYFGSILVISSGEDRNLERQRLSLKFEHSEQAFQMMFCCVAVFFTLVLEGKIRS